MSSFLRAALGICGALSLVQTGVGWAAPEADEQGEVAQSTSAQPPPQAPAELNEIIVTARRVEERLQDVPISMTVLNQAQVANRNIVNSSDLAAYVPSLSMNNTLGNASASFSIRGFVQDIGTAPSVAVYFADVVAPRGGSNNFNVGDGAGPGQFFDLQNVQVLKGPQGTLFGRNTTGGAILLVPQKPTADRDGYVEVSYGNYDMIRLQAVFNTPLGDSLRFRIGVDHQTRDGFVDNTTGIGPAKFNDVAYTSLRASLVADVTSNIENYTIFSGTYSDSAGEPMKLVGASPTTPIGYLAALQLANSSSNFYSVANDFAGADSRLSQEQLINTTSWKPNDQLTAKNIISYAQLTYDLNGPVGGVNFNLANLNPLLPGIPGVPAGFAFPPNTPVSYVSSIPVPGGHTSNQSTFTEEPRLEGSSLNDKMTWQTGLYLELSDPIGLSGSLADNLIDCPGHGLTCANPFFGDGSVSSTTSKKTTRDYGVYGQATYDITDQLAFTGGTRYTWDETKVTGALTSYVTPFGFTPVPPTAVVCQNPLVTTPGCTQTVQQDSHAPTWLVDLDYKPSPDVLTYVKYSRGYRTGGVTLQAPTEFQTFRPEKVNTYEIGIKNSFSGPVKGTFNVAAFYNDFTDQQVILNFTPKVPGTVPNASGIANVGASKIYGVEVESSLVPFEGLTVDFGYTYLHTEITQLSVPTISGASPYEILAGESPAIGDPLEFAPENKYTVTAMYTLPFARSWGRIAFGPTFTHTDSEVTEYTNRDATGQLTGPSILGPRNLLDLNLNWTAVAGSRFDLSLFADNVMQKKYYTYELYWGTYSAFETAQLGNPLFYGVRLRYNFGH
jgi:iron complex outermembrane receptor protein